MQHAENTTPRRTLKIREEAVRDVEVSDARADREDARLEMAPNPELYRS